MSREDSGEIVGLDWDEEEESTHVFPSSHPPAPPERSASRASSGPMTKQRDFPGGLRAPSNVDYSQPPSTDTLRLDNVEASPVPQPQQAKPASMFPPPPPIPSITQARPMEFAAIPGILTPGSVSRTAPQPTGGVQPAQPLAQEAEEVRDQAFVRLPSGNPHSATELAIKKPVMPAFVPSTSVTPPAARESGAKKWMLGAAAAFALLSIIGLSTYLFTRRPGSMQVDVRDAAGSSVPRAEVYVDGRPVCNATPCLVKDLDVGRHSVRVIVPGSQPIEPKTIDVDAGAVANVSFSLEPPQTTLVVAGSQAGVRLSIDGVDKGPLPVKLAGLSPGRHELKLFGDRYKPVDRVVDLEAGKTLDLGEIKLAVAKGRLSLAVKGEGVTITLVPEGGGRGKALDPPFTTPIEIDTSTGTWKVVAKKADNPDFTQAVDFSDGVAEKVITVDFARQPDAISLNDLPSSTSSTASATSTAPAGKGPPAAGTTSTPPTTRPDKPEPSETASGSGTLNINSIPASRVLLDGQPLGETPRTGVSVSPGTHTVTFIHPELGKKSISVKVGPGETKSAVAKLRSE
jgi:serine/threonine-protein kinase